jgi:hypothetical protein
MIDWPTEIAVLGVIKSTMAGVDVERIFEYRLPRVGASEERLRAVEASLGHRLPTQYREFLAYGDGWPAFWQFVDLFGTHELEGEVGRRVSELTPFVEPALAAIGLVPRQVLTIGVNRTAIDVFIIELDSGPAPGAVHWIAGEEVQAFPDFHEFYLAMLDCARLDIDWLRARHSADPSRPAPA